MAEEITDVSLGTETTDASVETPVSTETTDTPETDTATTETSVEADAPDWNTPFEFPEESDEEVTDKTEQDETPADAKKEGDESPTPESGDVSKVKDDSEAEEDEEDIDKIDASAIDPSKPPKLSRRQREKVVADIIDPFRDHTVPPEDVLRNLYALDPDRAQDLASTIAEASAKTHPDLWLSTILGEEVTVADVKAKLSTSTQAQAKATGDSFSAVEDALNETYGDAWKDESRDAELLGEDLALAKALRSYRSNENAKDTEIATLRQELESLKPQIDSIKDAQLSELEREKEDIYWSAVTEYRSELEKKSLDKLFKDAGLVPQESDTEKVKALKEYITSRFDGRVTDDFDRFFGSQFSDREKGEIIIGRVDQYFKNAAEAEAAAKRAKGSQAEECRLKANAYRGQAKAEQAALAVLHRKASQEYLEKILNPVMGLLTEIGAEKRRAAQTRPELVDGQSTAGGDNWKKRIEEAENPWEVDDGWDALAVGR